MKLTFFVALIFFNLSCVFGQEQASIWYFGNNAGLDFRSGSPVALTDGELATEEGCSTISDNGGNLLFYSDGITIWNKNHEVMANGEELLGDISSSQSAIIIPNPSDRNIYYIFTVSQHEGLHFSEVDMQLDNGLGAVTDDKNVLLVTPTAEKITAVEHANGEDIWVITHGADDDSFLSYLVTAAGVNKNPVQSNVGINLRNGSHSRSLGYLKASPDGGKLGIAHWRIGVELLDFNNTTGRVSNPIVLTNKVQSHYGIEFSPSGKVLYRSMEKGEVVQYDLLADDIPASETLIYDSPHNFIGALQLGIDGKIYVANKQKAIDVIHDPDVVGEDCNYDAKTVNLNGRSSKYGLPPFIQSFFYIGGISAENFCRGDETSFSIDVGEIVQKFLWDFGDGKTSTEQNPGHTYESAGEYSVKVSLTIGGRTVSSYKDITIYETPEAHDVEDVFVCDKGENQDLDLTTFDDQILGSQSEDVFQIKYFSSLNNAEENTDALPSSFSITGSEEIIYARISNEKNPGCFDITDFKVVLSKVPVQNEINDWMICGADENGAYTIDLSEKTAEVLEGQDRDVFSVLWFETLTDAEENRNALDSQYSGTAPVKNIYFRVHNTSNQECYTTGGFQFEVLPGAIAHSPTDFVACGTEEGSVDFSFDLASKDAEVLGEQDPEDFTVSYYISESNALDDKNPLQKKEYAYSAPGERIFVRVNSKFSEECYSINSFELLINRAPRPKILSEYTICPDMDDLELDGGNFDMWQWTDESGDILSTSRHFSFSKPGKYSLTVGTTKNSRTCRSSKDFEIRSSQTASDFTFVTEHFSGENQVKIQVDEPGDFEYSLDGRNFQTQNSFYVSPGVYTAYVRDVQQCQTLEKEVVVLGKMKFFTPNGDGYNDYWNVTETGNFDRYEVLIFDRYGKLLKQLLPGSRGWDGTFNGRIMPSDDYWFTIEIEGGNTYNGHFTLKR